MSIAYFGTYERDYPRNYLVINLLRSASIPVVELHESLFSVASDKTTVVRSPFRMLCLTCRLILGYIKLSFRYARCSRSIEAIMVGYFGHGDMFVAAFLAMITRKKLIFNPLISLYDTLAIDRALVRKKSFARRFLYWIDKKAFQWADCVLLDTHAHIRALSSLFKIPQEKFARLFVGADPHLFIPRYSEKKDRVSGVFFTVLFYGKYIPLHGIETIIAAAQLLEHYPDIRFRLIGKGQQRAAIDARIKEYELTNIEMVDWIPYESLPLEIADADVCLGIFGTTSKTRRVIPNKVFQVLACKKPLITSDTPAIHELLENNVHALLCPAGNPVALAEKVLLLKNDGTLRCRIAQAGYERFCAYASFEPLREELVKILRHFGLALH